jgi:uncharacterized Ntn-hydrolase superfamily protein
MIDTTGNPAFHTGGRCITEAGHMAGNCYSVQTNMMLNNSVWPAMANAFENSNGKFATRFINALHAGQNAGGDIRGKQSAALMTTEKIRDDTSSKHMRTNLRIDDHINPIFELQRLLDLECAYNLMNKGNDMVLKNQFEPTRNKYQKAVDLAPDIEEILF